MGIRLYCNQYNEYTSSYMFWNSFRKNMIQSYLTLNPNPDFDNKISTIENNGELFSSFLDTYEQTDGFIDSGVYLLINRSDCLSSFYSIEETHKILTFLNDIQKQKNEYTEEILQLKSVFEFSVANKLPVYIE